MEERSNNAEWKVIYLNNKILVLMNAEERSPTTDWRILTKMTGRIGLNMIAHHRSVRYAVEKWSSNDDVETTDGGISYVEFVHHDVFPSYTGRASQLCRVIHEVTSPSTDLFRSILDLFCLTFLRLTDR